MNLQNLPSLCAGTLLLGVFSLSTLRLSAASAVDDVRYQRGEVLYSDDFAKGLEQWTAELEKGGTVEVRDGELNIDVPGGCTVWFKPKLEGPVLIEYEVKVVSAGGANDRVSDMNCFWMARDSRSPEDIFATTRSGKFSDYDLLKTYYVGHGGNSNTTTRFRRYIGEKDNRPLLPENDLKDAAHLLQPNEWQTLTLVACGPLIQYFRNGERVFEMTDGEAYTSGWFAIRTVTNHMTVRHFKVYRLQPAKVATTETK